LLLELEVRLLLVLPVFAEVRAVMLSSELVEALGLSDVLLTMPLCPVILDVELTATFEEVVELDGADGLKMTIAKISPGDILGLSTSN
jgi:hypothetical protein